MAAFWVCLSVLATYLPGAVAKPPGEVAPTDQSSPLFHHRAYLQTVVCGDFLYIDESTSYSRQARLLISRTWWRDQHLEWRRKRYTYFKPTN